MRLLLLALFPALLHAQSAFLTNRDIVWAKEIEIDWIVDAPSFDDEFDLGINTLKLLRTEKNEEQWEMPFLSSLVVNDALNDRLAIFSDPKCTKQVDGLTALSGLDTVITFDPETYEEKIQVVRHCVDGRSDVKAWRLREVLCYNAKTAGWSAFIEAVAPLGIRTNSMGDSIGLKPLFWFRPVHKSMNINNKDIVWAKEIKSKLPENLYDRSTGVPVKITADYPDPVADQLKVLGNNMKIPFYDFDMKKLLTPSERLGMLSRTDTIVTFDPETYEEKVQVVHNDLNADNICNLRLIHRWYWDEDRHRLAIVLVAVAPMKDVLTPDGDLRYRAPMYYWKSKE